MIKTHNDDSKENHTTKYLMSLNREKKNERELKGGVHLLIKIKKI